MLEEGGKTAGSDNSLDLLGYSINYDRKKFYSLVVMGQNGVPRFADSWRPVLQNFTTVIYRFKW